MRPRDATVAALLNLKFQGVVIQTLISEYDKVSTGLPFLFVIVFKYTLFIPLGSTSICYYCQILLYRISSDQTKQLELCEI